MISQNSGASSEESFEKRKKRKVECSCCDTAISYTKRVIPFVRDFPKDYGPWGRFAIQCSQYSVQSELSSSSSFYYSSESEDLVVPLLDNALESVSSKEVERKDVPQALDTTNPIDLLKTSDHETKELPEKVVSKFMPKGYKPHKRVLVIRDYPIPPRRFQTPFSEDLVQSKVPDSSPRYDSELEETPKALDDIKQIDLEETSEYEAKELSKESECEFRSSRSDLGSGDSIISMYNISLNSFGLSEEEEEEGIDMSKVIDPMGLIDQSETSEHEATDLTEKIASKFMPPILPPNTIDSTTTDFPKGCKRKGPQIREDDILKATTFETKALNHKLSDAEESCSTNSCKSNLKESENLSQYSNQSLDKGPSNGENQVPKGHKQIVIALMAAPNYPRTQKKTASRSKSTRNTNKRKRKKH